MNQSICDYCTPTMRHSTSTRLASDGNHSDLRATVDFGSRIDYHNSLLAQARQQHESARPRRPHEPHQCHSSQNHSRGSLLQWLPLSNTRKTGTTANNSNNNNTIKRCRTKNEKDQSNAEVAPLPPHPHLTRKDIEEFEALPVAIRRKYFSTLERLRLAQTSGILDTPSDANRDARRHHSKLRGASLSAAAPGKTLDRPTTAPSGRHHAASVDSAFLARLPAKIREKHLTREEQLIIAKHLRQSVILDAADEAFLKAGRFATRRPSPPPHYPPTLSSSPRASMESISSDNASAGAPDALYDSFRWLDEDDDLDLRLALDDYHVNLKESVSVPPQDPRPPSFRRHLSFSKIPFGRPSISSSRPGTKDAAPPTAHSASPSQFAYPQPVRRKSRALSLITPKHGAHESISSIDPGAAHYQDPEARLKLRVYLASPQKFDEAIEFGFPSNDPPSASTGRDLSNAQGYSRFMFSPDSEKFKTFLSDDRSSTYSEDASLPDPESPKTPNTPDKHAVKPLQRSSTNDYPSRLPEGYAQVPAASREMTLRMTLTRPDLRACEDQMYGWQKNSRHSSKPSQILALRDDMRTPSSYARDAPKESMDKIFAEIDQELGSPASADNNVMKRLWNRVRRN
ncbi:uncharacterized protein F4822DRAFT_411984 [Hypoxylon trugodes]|uniref:uncharacterized protein n=1 Tax=Hypoxylon trugodes TaxID=326681 RepID=UPI0021973A2C|nr:uncharacterized protein F4822DRAFT_411984 [Hypoxylon trugodes]KAI1387059.1 hypothetical protein F4822DRAFT_411984 [Hypoxylon trugodes]